MSEKQIEQTYYEILEISADSGHHEVVAAYERAKAAYSPDSPALYTMFTQEEAEELRRLVEEAFLILGNQAKRREYDLVLKARMKQPTAEELPDFVPSSPSGSGASSSASNSVRTQNQSSTHVLERTSDMNAGKDKTVPAGFAKSRISVYEVNEKLEAEFAAVKDFDGEALKKVRQYKNINIDQMSKETRISRSYLAALESNDYEALPAAVFTRGFVVQVCRILNIDENLAANTYMARFKKGK
jgi:curved DNA-binding protein CbpA